MSPSMQPTPSQPTATAACIHRWRVGRPVEGRCAAVCAHCGAARVYPASVSAAPTRSTVVIPGA